MLRLTARVFQDVYRREERPETALLPSERRASIYRNRVALIADVDHETSYFLLLLGRQGQQRQAGATAIVAV